MMHQINARSIDLNTPPTAYSCRIKLLTKRDQENPEDKRNDHVSSRQNENQDQNENQHGEKGRMERGLLDSASISMAFSWRVELIHELVAFHFLRLRCHRQLSMSFGLRRGL